MSEEDVVEVHEFNIQDIGRDSNKIWIVNSNSTEKSDKMMHVLLDTIGTAKEDNLVLVNFNSISPIEKHVTQITINDISECDKRVIKDNTYIDANNIVIVNTNGNKLSQQLIDAIDANKSDTTFVLVCKDFEYASYPEFAIDGVIVESYKNKKTLPKISNTITKTTSPLIQHVISEDKVGVIVDGDVKWMDQ